MHRVRAYTFDFSCFLSSCLQFFMYYICGFIKESIALCSLCGRTCMFQDMTTSLSVKFGANRFNIGTVIIL